MAGKKAISPKWAAFAIEYVKSGNATDAYILAGYACKTRDNAQSAASQLLNNPTVCALVEKERRRVQRKLEISAEKTFKEIAALAFSDVRELFNEDGTLKDPHEWEDHVAAAVSSIEVFEEYQGEGKGKAKKYIGRTKKVRLWDKVTSLEKLARLLGMDFKDQALPVNVNVQVNQVNVADLSKLSVEDLEAILDIQQRAAEGIAALPPPAPVEGPEGTSPPVV